MDRRKGGSVKISPHPQGSAEWLEARKGIPTASEFAPFMVEQKTAAAKSAFNKYLCGKLTEAMPNDEFEQQAEDKESKSMEYNPWVQRGKALEPEARKALSKKLGREIIETGLVFHDCGEFAASPDGLIVGDDGNEWIAGCEIKCHNRKRHLADLLANVIPEDHKHQVHGCMIVTGLRQWHYFGFHPMQPSLHIVVDWDEFTDRLEAGLKTLVAEKAKIKATLAGMWRAEYGKAGA